MDTADTAGTFQDIGSRVDPGFDIESSRPSGLMDLLGVAAVLLDAQGRIVLWSPQAEELFGFTAQEALGQFAAHLVVREQDWDRIIKLFGDVMETGQIWAGAFPVRRKDGSVRLVEFRNMRLMDDRGDFYALGLTADEATLRQVERRWALSSRLISQSPIGLQVMDTDLRYVAVNPALERINGLSAKDHLGRTLRELLPDVEVDAIEAAMRQALDSGNPVVDQYTVGRTPADPDHDHAWSVSFYRLEDPNGQVLGLAGSVVDVTDRHRSVTEVARARRRLALIADASVRVGTTLEVGQTARELAEVAVPELADMVAVDVLDAVLEERQDVPSDGPALFRALAVKADRSTEAVRAADPPGHIARYEADRLATRCARTGKPILVPRADDHDLAHIARDAAAAALLSVAGVHSYMAVPLIARGEVLGSMGLYRWRPGQPFSNDDLALAVELASRAAVAIDNARWYQSVHNTAMTLQRSLLPDHPSHHPGLQVASRYQPAQASKQVGGDWYDVIPLSGEKTALVVGDVMGSGIDAAATMGRLRTATCTLADLDLTPDQVLHHLDKITSGLEHYIATCVYAIYDPRRAVCDIAVAGHLPPALVRTGCHPELLDLPCGVPLGVGGIPFQATAFPLAPGDQLVLYTDGLVETREHPIDEGLDALLRLLGGRHPSLEETCDCLLRTLRHPGGQDDVALLIARAEPVVPGAVA